MKCLYARIEPFALEKCAKISQFQCISIQDSILSKLPMTDSENNLKLVSIGTALFLPQ